jgi:hypothetical protein
VVEDEVCGEQLCGECLCEVQGGWGGEEGGAVGDESVLAFHIEFGEGLEGECSECLHRSSYFLNI